MYTTDLDYTNMRLQNTIVRNKRLGILVRVFVVDVGNDGFLATVRKVGHHEKNEDEFICPLEELDLSSPPLGNVDWNGNTYYVTRLPKRNDWRQGLRKDNLGYVFEGRLHNYNIPSMKILGAPVFNKYKPYKKGRAFSRNFNVDKGGQLWYKGREVVGEDVGGIPVLNEKYEWLEEALRDALKR